MKRFVISVALFLTAASHVLGQAGGNAASNIPRQESVADIYLGAPGNSLFITPYASTGQHATNGARLMLIPGKDYFILFPDGQLRRNMPHGGIEYSNDLQPFLGAHDVTAADLDGDGKNDIVVSFYEEGKPIWLYHGRGDGTFETPIQLTGFSDFPDGHDGTNRVRAADVTGDGKRDIITTHDLDQYQMIAIRPFISKGVYGPPIRLEVDTPDEIAIADLDNDGASDILVSGRATSSVTYVRSRGNGQFDAPARLALGGEEYHPGAVVVADFNRDARMDIAVLNKLRSGVTILYGKAAG